MRPELSAALAKAGPLVIAGSTPGWAAWLAAQLAKTELVVIVAPDDDGARRLETDVRFLIGGHDPTGLDPIAVMPSIDIEPYAELSPDRDAIVERLATLYRLAVPELRPRIILTSAAALVRKTMPAAELASRGRVIKVGDTLDRDALATQLIGAGWSRLPVTDEPGTFAVRGGVIDVFAPLSPHPIRIELFGDEVETLRWFDAESQRTLRPIDQLILHPVRETIATGDRDVRTRVREYADEMMFPTKAARRLIEQLEAGEVFVKSRISVPDTILFRAGGDGSVRGYGYRTLGPTRNGAVVGGKVLLAGSVELEHPLTARLPALLGAVFVDAGDAADRWRDIRPVLGYGVGLHYRSPIGPLRLDVAYGQAVKNVRVHLSIGVVF